MAAQDVLDDPDDYEKQLNEALDTATTSVNEGAYAKAMKDLLAKSMTSIKNAVPKASYDDYTRLLTVVERASAANISQANLKTDIEQLGGQAVNIAKSINSLANLFL